MQLNGLDDLAANGVHRRERAHGLLKDHADVVAAHLPNFGSGGLEGGQVNHLRPLAAVGGVFLPSRWRIFGSYGSLAKKSRLKNAFFLRDPLGIPRITMDSLGFPWGLSNPEGCTYVSPGISISIAS